MLEFPENDPRLAHIARQNMIFEIGADSAGARLDVFLPGATGLSRGLCRKLIDFGSVWVGGKVCRRQGRMLEAGEYVTFQAPGYGPVRFYEIEASRIIYQDDSLVAYDKEAGIPSQQTPYDGYNHLFGALVRHFGPEEYLALHHRLDAPTSGVMVFCRQRSVNRKLGELFSRGSIVKTYLAVASGRPPAERFEIDRPIAKKKGGYYCPGDKNGKPARTIFETLGETPRGFLVRARPMTGRTHQIRLHLAEAGCPIVGDPVYGGPRAERLMLHAKSLAFDHPVDGKPLQIEAPTPEGFEIPGEGCLL